ncbi:MAG: GtrA family protein [Methanobrevibacter sp.]|uniref:GtrA family protein n=1 Tax=Methanobrevibacter sp. TaxID=66852 RepID=UPI0025F66CB9|nr:GtrA family protein [Methanobrevibacter sp.]MBE6498072.1 GtrA family protein [Methanobrevibacter sp.]MBE6499361.1 GtrA family protein [Methanobrevibacter thaueri]
MKLIDRLFRQPTDNIFIQMFRYIFVGGTAFVVDFFFLYFFSDICHIHYLISGILSFIISVMVNYWMSTQWVFNQDGSNNRFMEFNMFLLISTIGLVFTEILLWFFTDIMGMYYLISKIIAAVIVLFWNFLARRVMFYGRDFI